MAIEWEDEYTDTNPADAGYPFGSAKNASTPTSLDGTPLEKKWMNDFYGFFSKLLDEASITPSGSPDTIVASDYWDGLIDAIDTRVGIVSGTKMVFFQAAAPTGWTQDVSQNDKALRIVSGAGGGNGGSLALSATDTGSHVLITAEIPSHTHLIGQGAHANNGSSGGDGATKSAGLNADISSGAAGGDGGHDHPLELAYIDVIICTKD